MTGPRPVPAGPPAVPDEAAFQAWKASRAAPATGDDAEFAAWKLAQQTAPATAALVFGRGAPVAGPRLPQTPLDPETARQVDVALGRTAPRLGDRLAQSANPLVGTAGRMVNDASNFARAVPGGLVAGAVPLVRTGAKLAATGAAGPLLGPLLAAPVDRALTGLGQQAQAGLDRALQPGGPAATAGRFVGAQVPGLVAFGGLTPVGEAAAEALPLAGRLAPYASRIASTGTTAALVGAASEPDHPVRGALAGLKYGAGGEAVLAPLTGALKAPAETPLAAGAAEAARPPAEVLTPPEGTPLRRRLADAIDPQGAQLREQALVDPKTRLGSQAAFVAARPALDAHPQVEWVTFDADRFKALNDKAGHGAGDAALTQWGNVLNQAGRDLGIPVRGFRNGGDELSVAVPVGAGEPYRQLVEARAPYTANGVTTTLTGRVGPTFEAADQALTAFKDARRTADPSYQRAPASSAAPEDASAQPGVDATAEAPGRPVAPPTPGLPPSDALTAADAATGAPEGSTHQAVQDGTARAGFGTPPVIGGLAGGVGGAAIGAATGQTPQDRARNAALGALAGGAVGVGAGRLLEGAGVPAEPPPAGVTPDPRATATGFAKVADDFRRLFAPTTRTPEAETTGLLFRRRLGQMKQANAQTMQALGAFRDAFRSTPEADRLAFIDRMERGAPQPTPELTAAASALRTTLDATRDQIQALGTGKLDHFLTNYFPHIWENPEGTQSVIGRMLGQRPLEGSKSFLKQRTIPTTAEGIAAGLTPVTTNPVDLTMLKLREMRKYLMAQQVLADLKGRNLLRFVRSSEPTPDGWALLNDRVSTVYGPRELSPAGPVIVGHHYAPAPVAEVINNYLAPGLGGNALYDAYRTVGNTLNQAQLGLSAFHLGFTSLDAAISKVALGVMQGSRGDVPGAFRSVFGAPFAPVTTLLKGSKVIQEYLTPGSQPAFADVVRSVTQAGGVAHLDDFYRTGMWDRFRDDWQQHTAQMVGRTLGGAALAGGTGAAYGALTAGPDEDATARAARYGAVGAGLGAAVGSRALGAALDLATKPVMEYVVPRQKLGVFADLSREMIARLGPDASPDAVHRAVAEAWNSVDNRMGQLVYDNLFWHRAAKDLALASVRSVGWNLGDFRELGGGITDVARTAREVAGGTYHGLSPRTAYTLALPIAVGLAGGVMTYLATGERPQSLLDYYYPRTGRQNPDGTEERVQLPSYTRDVYAYAHHPWTTLQHKLNPLAEGVAELLNNKDFYGNMVRNPDDPALTQLGQVAAFAADQFTPFGIANALDARRRGQSDATTAANFVGVTPAPREVVRSDAENRMQELLARRGIIINTPEQVAARNARFDLERQLRDDPAAGRAALTAAVQAGTLTRAQRAQMLRRTYQDPTKLRFQQLTLPEALDVYQRATPEERQAWWPVLLAKRASASDRGDRAALRAFAAARPMDLPRGTPAAPSAPQVAEAGVPTGVTP